MFENGVTTQVHNIFNGDAFLIAIVMALEASNLF
jgi:hypothetical protein